MRIHCADEFLQANNFGQSSSSGGHKGEPNLSYQAKNPLSTDFSGCGGRGSKDYLDVASAGSDCGHLEEIVVWAVAQLVGPSSSCQRKQLEVNNLKTQVNVEVNLQKGTQMKTL